MTPDLELHIQELVLPGLARRDADQIAEVLHSELSRLLGAWQGSLPGSRETPIDKLADTGTHPASGTSAAIVGARIAWALYRSLAR